jgi:hypothetical protein
MREDGGQVVPPDGIRPAIEQGLDPDLITVDLFRHGAGSCAVAARPA